MAELLKRRNKQREKKIVPEKKGKHSQLGSCMDRKFATTLSVPCESVYVCDSVFAWLLCVCA